MLVAVAVGQPRHRPGRARHRRRRPRGAQRRPRARQEMNARKASVDALAKMQIPQARVFRDGALVQIAAHRPRARATSSTLEAGDIVPADGRILRSATLETQEAALTGESAPIAKDPRTLDRRRVPLGDRANMVFQNTTVTRGTATIVVTDTGMTTQMGQIASMLSSVEQSEVAAAARARLAHQGARLDRVGRGRGHRDHRPAARARSRGGHPARHLDGDLGHPDRHADVRAGDAVVRLAAARRAKAVVKNLTDVETLGATSAINSDKTGTLTMNEMTVESLYSRASGTPSTAAGTRRPARSCRRRAAETRTSPRSRYGLMPGQRRDRVRRRRRDRRPDRGRARRARRQDGRRRRADPRGRTRASPRCRSTRRTSSWRRSTR